MKRASSSDSDGGYLMRLGFAPSSDGEIDDDCKEEGEGRIVWIDASCVTSCVARYINDPLLPVAYNCEFVKFPLNKTASVVATRDIGCGEELFVSYGKGYWSGGKGVKLSLRDLARCYRRIVEEGGKLVEHDDVLNVAGLAP